jgi:hypothetical protein
MAEIVHNLLDPDPWAALLADRSVPIDPTAKAMLIASQRSRSRQFLLPFVRPVARLSIILVQVLRVLTPKYPDAPLLLHRLMAWGMKKFVRPDANVLILRHFHLGAEILAFIADNATPGYRPKLEPMQPLCIDDIRDAMFVKHDLNIFNFLIMLNAELDARGTTITRRDAIDFSAISDVLPPIAVPPPGRWNRIDLETAIEFYTPLYALLLRDSDFWRAANSLQLDETVALYAARLLGAEQHLALVNNRHPMVPLTTLRAGYRLMLHGLASETLHGFLREAKAEARRAQQAQESAATPQRQRAGRV